MKNELQHLFCVNGPPLRKQFYSKAIPKVTKFLSSNIKPGQAYFHRFS